MTLKNSLLLIVLLTIVSVQAQKKDRILFTIDKAPIFSSEFINVYEKNIDLVTDESQKNVTNYLELFINYKLKLKQAYALQLDTVPSYKRELLAYKKQLSIPFLKDTKITDALVKEAYDRSITDVHAAHILLRLNQDAAPLDTLKVYDKLIEIRKEIRKGKSFDLAAKEYSQDPSAKENGGDLGYFNAFRMVYPFETACYATKAGEISMPFRTRFGYHIVNVIDKRPSKGAIEVAHLMLKGASKEQQEKIYKIYEQINNGGKFEDFVVKFSEDKASASKGGRLRKFTSGDMIQSFEDVAYKLLKPGDISKPFKTRYGYHIIKLIKKHEISSFKSMKPVLVKKIEKDARSQLIANALIHKLKKQFTIKVNEGVLDSLIASKKNVKSMGKSVLLEINDKKITADTFVNPLNRSKIVLSKATFEKFKSSQILNYYKENLENLNKEFAFILQEYKDGLLLFDLLQNKVWKKSNDTIALQSFFEQHANNYQWGKRVKVDIAACKDLKTAQNLKAFLLEGMPINDVANKINAATILFNSGTFKIESKQLPANFKAVEGVSEIYKDKNHFTVVLVDKILPAKGKTLSEIKGKVISDFQAVIEKEWIADLRKNHVIEIEKKALKKIIKKYRK